MFTESSENSMNIVNMVFKGSTQRKTIKSSKYGRQMMSLKSPKQVSIKHWKAAGALVSLNGIRSHRNSPHGVINAVKG